MYSKAIHLRENKIAANYLQIVQKQVFRAISICDLARLKEKNSFTAVDKHIVMVIKSSSLLSL